MVEQLCPVCGCQIGEDAYEEGGTLYCCVPCATEGQCECGCCEEEEQD
ncbi:MAG: metallothionein [Dehalococcoidia bacterium]|nr:MAG: metallothionein [Dehalococcoidia bacterium]